ncbi:MAG: putative alpha/beta hydrolase [Pseudonocardiales bacterium]
MLSKDDLAARAGVHPWKLRDDLADGNPGEISTMASAWANASGHATEATAMAQEASQRTADAYTVAGAAVHDSTAHVVETHRQLGLGGEEMYQVATLLDGISDHLTASAGKANTEITTLDGKLQAINNNWTTFVQQQGHGLPPEDLQAARDGFINQAVEAVSAHGTTIKTEVDTYEEFLSQNLRSLAGLGIIPPPPPEPEPDSGAGEFDSDSWWTKGDDYLKEEIAKKAADAAELIGYTDAARHLRHYLSASGDDLTVDPDHIMRDVPTFQAAVDQTASAEINRIAQEAAASGKYGTVPISTDWQGHIIREKENPNWYFAMGSIEYSVTGAATVHPPTTPGGQPQVDVDYKVHVWDRYNWDEGKNVKIGPITIHDEELAEMHRAGVAREYDMVGSSDMYHYEGPPPPAQASPGQAPSLPQAPDNRDGGRGDPGRDHGPPETRTPR